MSPMTSLDLHSKPTQADCSAEKRENQVGLNQMEGGPSECQWHDKAEPGIHNECKYSHRPTGGSGHKLENEPIDPVCNGVEQLVRHLSTIGSCEKRLKRATSTWSLTNNYRSEVGLATVRMTGPR
jgi:hypothetical protein